MDGMSTRRSLARAAQIIRERGFDVVQEFNTDWYNQVKSPALVALPENRKALLIGNSKTLWPKFIQYYQDNLARDLDNPFDTFIEETFEAILDEFDPTREQGNRLYFSHQFQPDKVVSFQRVADVSGAAMLDEKVHLCVHREFGPWFALRAILILTTEEATPDFATERPQPLMIELDPKEVDQAQMNLEKALTARKEGYPNPHEHFIAVRDAISYGRQHRYDQVQLLYHYTKSKDILRQAI